MIIVLIVVLTLVGVISLLTGRLLPQEFAMFPLVSMIILDFVVIYFATNLFGMEGKEITAGILGAMLLKITTFILMQLKNPNTKPNI